MAAEDIAMDGLPRVAQQPTDFPAVGGNRGRVLVPGRQQQRTHNQALLLKRLHQHLRVA